MGQNFDKPLFNTQPDSPLSRDLARTFLRNVRARSPTQGAIKLCVEKGPIKISPHEMAYRRRTLSAISWGKILIGPFSTHNLIAPRDLARTFLRNVRARSPTQGAIRLCVEKGPIKISPHEMAYSSGRCRPFHGAKF